MSAQPAPPPRPKKDNTILWMLVVIVVTITVVASVAVLITSPGKSFSATIVETCGLGTGCTGVQTLSFPVGSQVSGTWTTSSADTVVFTIYTPGIHGGNGTSVYNDFGDVGSFSFTADYSSYNFTTANLNAVAVTTSVSGTYS